MATIADITINDGKATPVAHTFKPTASGSKSGWRTADSTLPLVGQEVVSTALSTTRTGVNVVSIVMDLPALETATGANAGGYTAAPKVAYSHRIKMELMLPNRGTTAQRKDLRVLL